MGYNGTPGDSSNGMIESVTAQNAKPTVNNVEIENSSNTISDSLEDITLNLNDVTTGNQTLTISKDTHPKLKMRLKRGWMPITHCRIHSAA